LTAIKRLRETKKPFHRMRNDCSIHAAVRAQHSQFAAGQGGEFGELHCKLCKQCRSNPVSGQSLPKTGVFQCTPETIGYFALRTPETGTERPAPNSQKPAIGGPLREDQGNFL
jgi:hypothetical protein